jgi:hypothetical protein
MGRKYSLGKYGDNSYDLHGEPTVQLPWEPIPDPPPGEPWIPISVNSASEPWGELP